MKKIICLLLAALCLLALGACRVETGTTSSDSSEVVSVDPADYREDGLAGLANCLLAAKYISGEPTEMEASFIGAQAGRRYSFSYNGSNVTVEIYEFADENAETLKTVDETGSFTVLGTETVEATHAGRYLLVYNDNSKKDENAARREDVLALFRRFCEEG